MWSSAEGRVQRAKGESCKTMSLANLFSFKLTKLTPKNNLEVDSMFLQDT